MPASTRGPRPAVPAGSAADAIVRALAEAGTRLMFGVPGTLTASLGSASAKERTQ